MATLVGENRDLDGPIESLVLKDYDRTGSRVLGIKFQDGTEGEIVKKPSGRFTTALNKIRFEKDALERKLYGLRDEIDTDELSEDIDLDIFRFCSDYFLEVYTPFVERFEKSKQNVVVTSGIPPIKYEKQYIPKSA